MIEFRLCPKIVYLHTHQIGPSGQQFTLIEMRVLFILLQRWCTYLIRVRVSQLTLSRT